MGDPYEVIRFGVGASPQTVTLSESGTVALQTARAAFDGTSSVTAWLPALTIRSQDGTILARVFPDTQAEAGDSADVSFAPFLSSVFGGNTPTPPGDASFFGRWTAGTPAYYAPFTGQNTDAPPLGTMVAYPTILTEGMEITQLGIFAGSGGAAGPPASVVRLGLYRDNGNGVPGIPVIDGTVSGVLSGQKQVNVSYTVPATDVYWPTYVAQAQTTVPIVTSFDPANTPMPGLWARSTAPNLTGAWTAVSVTGVTGALPNPFGVFPLLARAEAAYVYLQIQ